jgi:transposase
MTELYAGIDLHSTNNVLVVCDAGGHEVYRRRLRNSLELVAQALEPHRESLCGVVVESTYNWYWLVDGLMDLGHDLHLANTGAIQKYSGLKHADDNSDARWLAEMLRLGILPEGHIYPKEERSIRDLVRKRAHLVRQRTSNMLSIKNILTRNTGVSLNANDIKRLDDETIDGMFADANLALSLKTTARTLQVQREQIALIEKAALEQVRLRGEYKNLLTVPGIGHVLALTIMLEAGDIHRFPTVGDFASYSRCVGSAHTSNGKKKGRGNTKNGNRYLGWAFVEAATFAVRYEPRIQRYYQHRKDSGKHMMSARAAVAHKLANACYHMLRDNTVFDLDKAFQ